MALEDNHEVSSISQFSCNDYDDYNDNDDYDDDEQLDDESLS